MLFNKKPKERWCKREVFGLALILAAIAMMITVHEQLNAVSIVGVALLAGAGVILLRTRSSIRS